MLPHILLMHEHVFLWSKSLDFKDSYDCNLGIVCRTTYYKRLITKEACVNGSGVEKVDGNEFETDILSCSLESKIMFWSCIIASKRRKNCVIWKTTGMTLRQKQHKYMKKKNMQVLMREKP